MPFRPGVDDDESLKRLIRLWADGETDLIDRKLRIWRQIDTELARGVASDLVRLDRLRLAAGRLDELLTVSGSVLDELTGQTRGWVDRGGMVDLYGRGAERVTVGAAAAISRAIPHRAAVDVLAQDLFDDVLAMTSHVDSEAKAWVRRVGRDLTGFKLTGGESISGEIRRFRGELQREFTSRGLTGVRYADGSIHGFGEYATVLLRTKTAVAYNTGTINQARGLGIEFFEILDGSLCGLAEHDDPTKANGLIVPVEIAAAFPIAHPNCRRSLNPRPDVNRSNLGDAVSVQSDAARLDQAQWEAYLRARGRSGSPPDGRRGALTAPPARGVPLTGRNARGPVQGQRGGLTGGSGSRRPSDAAREAARADRLRRRAYVEATRAEAQAARRALTEGRSSAVGDGSVDPAVLQRFGVSEAQWLNARALTSQVKRDIRQVAQQEADDVGDWLFNNDLSQLSRPARLRRSTSFTGQRVSVRDQAGYDWMESLDGPALARVRQRMVDNDLYTPDVVAEVVRQKTNRDMGDDEAMQWLVDRWLHEDALRSLASGRLPKYADPNNLIPADQAMEGYDLARLFGVDDLEAIGHVAQVQAEAAATQATRLLGRPKLGPAPWQMDAGDYAAELEYVDEVLSTTQIAEGIDPGPEWRWARARVRELVPDDLDPGGASNPYELHEAIRIVAQTAGLLDEV